MASLKQKTAVWNRGAFLGSFVFSFFFMVVGASSVGFVPYYIDGTEPSHGGNKTLAYSMGSIETGVLLGNLPMLGEENDAPASHPVRIVAKSIGLDLPVSNPTSTNVNVLDEALTSAVVRYPGSAQLGQDGNVLIFGHSSHLPVIYNQMYKAFNELPDLKNGAIISVVGENGLSYDYQVTSVRRADATEEYIDLGTGDGARLTLSTCDTFGKKTARWMVEADFIGTSNAAN